VLRLRGSECVVQKPNRIVSQLHQIKSNRTFRKIGNPNLYLLVSELLVYFQVRS
jgi:hypothetical protein